MSQSRRTFLTFVAASAASALCGGGTAHAAASVVPSQSVSAMQDFLALRGLSASRVTVPQLIENALEFYRSVRASGLAKGPESDMLLFQWGVFDWGKGERFEIDLTRQFISAGSVGDDAISQLRYTAYFLPTPALRGIPMSNRWCRSVAGLDPFTAFIHQSAAYRAVSEASPLQVQLRWEKV